MAASEIRESLTGRRARITPERAGLPAYGRRRRVSGLRRDEVAMLAGISVEYYIQVERGSVRGVFDDVLDVVARALQLDDVERAHLVDLVRAGKQRPSTRGATPETVRRGVQRVLETIDIPTSAAPSSTAGSQSSFDLAATTRRRRARRPAEDHRRSALRERIYAMRVGRSNDTLTYR